MPVDLRGEGVLQSLGVCRLSLLRQGSRSQRTKAAVTTEIRLQSTALQPFDDLRHDGLLYYGLNNVKIGWTGVGSSVKIWTGYGGNWCGTSVEVYWIGVGTKCLWCVVKVGCAMKGRGRFVRDVCEIGRAHV